MKNLSNKNRGLIDLYEIELNAFEIENDIILSHLGDSDEEFDNLVCNILTLNLENNSEVKPYQHRAILVLDQKTDELMAVAHPGYSNLQRGNYIAFPLPRHSREPSPYIVF